MEGIWGVTIRGICREPAQELNVGNVRASKANYVAQTHLMSCAPLSCSGLS